MSDDHRERARADQIRWQNEDWDREYRHRRAEADRAEARRAFDAGDLAWTAHKMGMTDLAIDIARGDFARPAEPREDPVLERLRLAESYLDQEENFRAELELDYVAKQGHPNPRVHFLLGVALSRQRKYADAAQAFRDAARRGAPADITAAMGARCLLAAEQFAAAEQWIAEALVQGTGDAKLEAELHSLSGRCRTRLDDHAGAVAAFERAVELRPDDGGGFAWLGGALVRTGRPREALQAFDRAEALGVKRTSIAFQRALAYLDSGDPESAERHLDVAVASDPDWTTGVEMRGRVRGRRGNWTGAAADFSRCIELNPKRMGHYIDRGICHLEANDFDAALADFTTAERLGPKSPRPPFYRAECLLAMGRVRDAQEAIARSLELGPNHEPALLLRERCWKA